MCSACVLARVPVRKLNASSIKSVSKETTLSEGAQLLLHILKTETKGEAVQLAMLGNKLKARWKQYQTGCLKELVSELTNAGLVIRKLEGKTTATLKLSRADDSIPRQASLKPSDMPVLSKSRCLN